MHFTAIVACLNDQTVARVFVRVLYNIVWVEATAEVWPDAGPSNPPRDAVQLGARFGTLHADPAHLLAGAARPVPDPAPHAAQHARLSTIHVLVYGRRKQFKEKID